MIYYEWWEQVPTWRKIIAFTMFLFLFSERNVMRILDPALPLRNL